MVKKSARIAAVAAVAAMLAAGGSSAPTSASVDARDRIREAFADAAAIAAHEDGQVRRSLQQAFNMDMLSGDLGPLLSGMDTNFMGDLLTQSAGMAKQACDPFVMGSMAAMFPPDVKQMYNTFCDSLSPKAAGDAIAEDQYPPSVEAAALESSANETATADAAAAEHMPELEQEREEGGMDYIFGMPVVNMDEYVNSFSSVFALEEQLPNLLDTLIEDAWEELGTEQQVYTAEHPFVAPKIAAAAAPVFVEAASTSAPVATPPSVVVEEAALEDIVNSIAKSLKIPSIAEAAVAFERDARGDGEGSVVLVSQAAAGHARDEPTFHIEPAPFTWEAEEAGSGLPLAGSGARREEDNGDDFDVDDFDIDEEEAVSENGGDEALQGVPMDAIIAIGVILVFVAIVVVAVRSFSSCHSMYSNLNERRYSDPCPSDRKSLLSARSRGAIV